MVDYDVHNIDNVMIKRVHSSFIGSMLVSSKAKKVKTILAEAGKAKSPSVKARHNRITSCKPGAVARIPWHRVGITKVI